MGTNNTRADGEYYQGKVETIDYIEQVVEKVVEQGVPPVRAYDIGQALRYVSTRLGGKDNNDYRLDLLKAMNYLHRARTGKWLPKEFLESASKNQ